MPLCLPVSIPRVLHERHRQNLEDFPHLKRWFETIGVRPAIRKVYAGAGPSYAKPMTEEERRVLFGQTAATREAVLTLSSNIPMPGNSRR